MAKENLKFQQPAAAADPADLAPRLPVAEAIRDASARIPPLWPLRHFVAVNPFLGLADRPFGEAAGLVRRIVHGELLMPMAFYRDEVKAGRITRRDMEAALALTAESRFHSASDLWSALQLAARLEPPAAPARVLTVAEALDAAHGTDWAGLAVEEVSKWCAAYFDEGQSAWRMPWRSLPLYAAWRRAAALDRTPEVLGLKGFRRAVAELPEDPEAAIATVLAELALPQAGLADFLHRQLASIGGWSSHVQYRVRRAHEEGREDDGLTQLLAIRLAYDHGLLRAAGRPPGELVPPPNRRQDFDLALRRVMQEAYDLASQRRFRAKIAAGAERGQPAERAERPAVQAVFCIDVRSEILRRSLENAAPRVETRGFAGFFGFPIQYIPFGHSHGTEQCPVLFRPPFRVRESVTGVPLAATEGVLNRRLLRKRLNQVWRSFRNSAVSSFAYVETAGLGYGLKLLTDSFGLTRTVAKPGTEGLAPSAVRRLGPLVHRQRGRLGPGGPVEETGIPFGERVKLAGNALRGMGLARDFARLVLFCGHGSTTVNNPYGTGLDCGACGGHSGEANARVAAAVLNDPEVRAALAVEGIRIPPDTWFLAGLHDTTTDAVRLFDSDRVPFSHSADLARLQRALEQASGSARTERARLLGLEPERPEHISRAVQVRSRDWSEVRPEWGLAGNAAFIAAPRERTRGVTLAGRAFLHDYDWRADGDGSILELILTAPLVVASWINLQYYASTVDNRRFGSGNKVIHNVVGTLGVLQGNGGDLQVGLPWQSLHDGRRLIHEPLRLAAFVEAPAAAIEAVLLRQPALRALLDNGWVHLLRLGEDGQGCWRYQGVGQWLPLD